MKKFLALLISAAMIFALVSIPAAADGEVLIKAGTVNDVEPGEKVTVPISLEGDYTAHILTVDVHYDPANVTVGNGLNIKAGELLPEGYADANWLVTKTVDDTNGVAKFGLVIGADPTLPEEYQALTGSGVLFTVDFTVNENCTEDQTISLEIREFKYMPLGETSGTPIPYTTEDGAINLVDEPEPTEPEPTEPEPTEPEPTEPEPTEPEPVEGNKFVIGSQDDVEPGSEVTVPVNAVINDEAHILNAVIEYDADVLEVVDAVFGSLVAKKLEGAYTSIDYTTTPGKIYVVEVRARHRAHAAVGVIHDVVVVWIPVRIKLRHRGDAVRRRRDPRPAFRSRVPGAGIPGAHRSRQIAVSMAHGVPRCLRGWFATVRNERHFDSLGRCGRQILEG